MSEIKLIAVGDTSPRENFQNIFEKAIPLLKKGDLRFTQVEGTYSNRGTKLDFTSNYSTRHDPGLVSEYREAGFDVVSLASNHSMDWGPECALDTIDGFRKLGIAVVGCGANLAEATKPVIFERKGIKVAFLAYCSIIYTGTIVHPGYWATETTAGNAPLRARTYYEAYDLQPATPAHILSIAEEKDLERMKMDIKSARAKADVVVVSMHWGVHFVPRYIADYQIQAGHAAIDAGCDIILGHHPHMLKGVEIYKGKPIIYSLGNFALPSPASHPPKGSPHLEFYSFYDVEFGPHLKYNRHQYRALSVVAEVNLHKDGRVELQFLPLYLENGRPAPLKQQSPKFAEVVEFLKWSSEPFNTGWKLKGGRLAPRM